MAEIFPPFENIDRLKVTPTDGEYFLLNYLSENLPHDYEVYFQPFLNGDMPDIVIMKKWGCVSIIEVKDWELNSYYIDEKNYWYENANGNRIRSPFKQVFGYKSNMFNLHIEGIAEKRVLNKNFFGVIKPFVYFHGSSKSDIDKVYQNPEISIKDQKNKYNYDYRNHQIDFSCYDKKISYLGQKTKQIRRDKNLSYYEERLPKIIESLKFENSLFTDEIYYSFKRYLKPPFHVINQGKDIDYSKKQTRLINSKSGFMKIKGVAGSGKTTILAKRAVNAHKRHGDKVLILTFNKTLRNLIRDKISAVREDFSWGMFGITNYHSFITQIINECGIEIDSTDEDQFSSHSLDHIYSDEKLFDDYQNKIYKYQTILIDEVQDYKMEWIKIIRKFFLSQDGEMVLFGDESQNIYERNYDKTKTSILKGFGSWERLTKSFRAKEDSFLTILAKEFQQDFLISKYDIDLIDIKPVASQVELFAHLDFLNGFEFSQDDDIENIYNIIFKFIKNEDIHPNDICIISSSISYLRKIEKVISLNSSEKLQTTFETEEEFNELQKRCKNKNALDRELETLRGSRKFAFNLNSGLMKLSTVHSFKGLEASTIIYFLMENDNDELVFTGISRAKRNLLLFIEQGSKYSNFFKNHQFISW
jgi:hypothetical protein